MIQIEFFHDAVCGWCYNLSPRLRNIAARYPVTIVQRAFVLQRNEQEMISRFGSLAGAKQQILQHWQSCKLAADDPDSINIEGMQAATFHYPHGYLAALYAKAVEHVAGQAAHWDFFDAVQRAHLYHNHNIADAAVLDAILQRLALPLASIQAWLHTDANISALEQDLARAVHFGVKTIPTLLLNGKTLVSQSLSLGQLEQLIESQLSGVFTEPTL